MITCYLRRVHSPECSSEIISSVTSLLSVSLSGIVSIRGTWIHPTFQNQSVRLVLSVIVTSEPSANPIPDVSGVARRKSVLLFFLCLLCHSVWVKTALNTPLTLSDLIPDRRLEPKLDPTEFERLRSEVLLCVVDQQSSKVERGRRSLPWT